MQDLETAVASHYASAGLLERLLDALRAAGCDVAALRPDDLAGVDEFHLGGRAATAAFVDALPLQSGQSVLDVGCGIGGAARFLARTKGVHVTGVDLTPEFVDVAAQLTQRVGLHDRAVFRVASGLGLPFPDGAFDCVTMIHVGMNIRDKPALFGELGRVVRDGGTVAVFDVMRTGDTEPTYPLPWAGEPETNAIEGIGAYREAMTAAGLRVADPVDRTSLVLDVAARLATAPPRVNLSHLMGPSWPVMIGNLVAAVRDGSMAPVQLVGIA